LATLLATGIKYGQEIGPTVEKIIQKGVTQPLLDGVIPAAGLFPVIKSPLTWMGIFAATRLHKRLKQRNQTVVAEGVG
jgi:hypothetical protein